MVWGPEQAAAGDGDAGAGQQQRLPTREGLGCFELSRKRMTGVVPRRLNKCGVISPRYDVKHGDLEAWVARLLPSRLVRAALRSRGCMHVPKQAMPRPCHGAEQACSKHTAELLCTSGAISVGREASMCHSGCLQVAPCPALWALAAVACLASVW